MKPKKTNSEFFDPEILNSLKSLGLVPPQVVEDFLRLEQELKLNPLVKPSRLKDPISFLDRTPKKKMTNLANDILEEYKQNLAYAARSGKIIPDHIKQKMKKDKQNSQKPNVKSMLSNIKNKSNF